MSQKLRIVLSIGLALAGISAVEGQRQNPAAATRGDVASALPGNYVLASNDIVLVKVFQEPDLDSQHRISRDGTIMFPLIGLVRIGGKTVEGASATIQEMLARGYLKHPQVRVNVLQYGERRFTVLGQVQKPGSYVIPGDQPISLVEAIGMAGGFTRLADTGKVIVRRNGAGQEKLFQLNASAHSADGTAFQVQPNDTITVGERMF